MPYARGRVIHDADAHIMELPGFLKEHLEARYRGRVGDDVLFPRREGFHSHLEGAPSDADQRFYCDNFVDFMGTGPA